MLVFIVQECSNYKVNKKDYLPHCCNLYLQILFISNIADIWRNDDRNVILLYYFKTDRGPLIFHSSMWKVLDCLINSEKLATK